jgi:2-keto-4-pentenoate hydratase/2-oxohepta-3-ene-1,7-dioic acid hydratase in catechol pathway
MRLVTYRSAGDEMIGVVIDGRIIDAGPLLEGAGLETPITMNDYIERGPEYWAAAADALASAGPGGGIPLEDASLAPPLRPRTIICGGANFLDHLDETHRAKPDHVEFFLKSPTGVIAHGDDVRMDPRLSTKYDYEVELAIVIGCQGRDVSPDRVFEYVFGYTIINDVSIRDQQVVPWDEGRFQLRFGEGKSYLDSAPLGPSIVTAEELRDVSSLGLRTRVDGVLRQNNSMANIIWNVPALVSYYSTYMTLEPGFVIASGTPGGPALSADLALGADPYERTDGVHRGDYVRDGQLVECEVDGIGTLRNRYVLLG